MEEWRYISTVFDLKAGCKLVVRLMTLALYPLDTDWVEGWVGPRAGLLYYGGGKNLTTARN
jgi:hypothetical protein